MNYTKELMRHAFTLYYCQSFLINCGFFSSLHSGICLFSFSIRLECQDLTSLSIHFWVQVFWSRAAGSRSFWVNVILSRKSSKPNRPNLIGFYSDQLECFLSCRRQHSCGCFLIWWLRFGLGTHSTCSEDGLNEKISLLRCRGRSLKRFSEAR